MTTPMQRRDAVVQAMMGHPISQRRACVLIGVDPKTVRRDQPPDNPEIRLEMHKIAEKRRRFGYRRIAVMLERVGMVMNEKKLYRIYREEGLSVPRRRGRKRARGRRHRPRQGPTLAVAIGQLQKRGAQLLFVRDAGCLEGPFHGSERGGERAAFMYTLINSCKMNNIDPQAWMADVLARLPDIIVSRLPELLP